MVVPTIPVPMSGHLSLTKDDHGGGGTAPLGHDVAGHAGVVPRIRETSLRHDEVVVPSRIDDAV